MVASGLGLQKPDGPISETGLSGFEVAASWSLPLSWSLSSLLKPHSTLLQPPLDFPPIRALLRHRPKSRSSYLFAPSCTPADEQEAHWAPSAPAGNQVLLLPPRKPDGPVWHFGLFGFPALKLLCPVDGRRVRSSHLLRSSLDGQNPE
jgi:hypothetical protein